MTTRDTSDFTIALLDAWATTLDVLTFYQERIANESYLRTATERLSLLELSREIGYVPRPAVASSTALAFTLDTSPGAPSPITIAVGVKVQSVPGPGETPHVFETIAAIEARREWSAIRPRLTSPQALSASASRIWIEGTDANLKAGDRLLIVTPVDRALRRVARVRPDNDNNRTSIDFEPLSGVPQAAASSESGVFVMRVKAAPFGHNAPLQIVGNTNGVPVTAEWGLAEPGEHLVTLDAVYDQICRAKLGRDRPPVDIRRLARADRDQGHAGPHAVSGRLRHFGTSQPVDAGGVMAVAPVCVRRRADVTTVGEWKRCPRSARRSEGCSARAS